MVPNGVETLPKISIAWVGCTNVTDRRQTDRQTTDRRQTDGRTTTYSERSLKCSSSEIASFHSNAVSLLCQFLANVNSCSCSLYVVVRPSVCRLSVVCLSSVTFMHPTQAIEIFGNVSAPFNTMVTWRHSGKIYGDRPRGSPLLGVLNRRGVAKYSDFGPLQARKRCKIGGKLLLMTNRKSHMTFDWYQSRWPWMTLNGVIALTAA